MLKASNDFEEFGVFQLVPTSKTWQTSRFVCFFLSAGAVAKAAKGQRQSPKMRTRPKPWTETQQSEEFLVVGVRWVRRS